MKKLLKEQDKLERQALVARMQQRDKQHTDDKRIGHIVENQEIAGKETFEDLKSIVPELRKQSRQAYLKQREEQIIDLYKRNLEDEKRVFGGEDLTSIEHRLAELKETLFDLAQKRRQKQEDVAVYRFPDADDGDE